MTYEVVALDTNVVIAVLDPLDAHHEVAVAFLEERAADPLILPAAVYAEVMAGPRPDLVKQFLREYRLRSVFNGMERIEVWELAGERFARYAANRTRSKGGVPRRILADFLIGAQVLLQPGNPALATLDAGFYRRYFPDLKIYALSESDRASGSR